MRPCRAGGCVCKYPFLQWAPQPAGAHLQMCVGPFESLSSRRIGLCLHAVEANTAAYSNSALVCAGPMVAGCKFDWRICCVLVLNFCDAALI